jgi:hypothetical protein
VRPAIRRHRSIVLVSALVALAASLCAPAPAGASSGAQVIADCYKHLRLTRTYSVPVLEHALKTIPAEVAEYTDCHDVIERALLTAEGKLHRTGSTTGGSSSSSFLPTPLLIVLIVLVLAAATLGGLALRRRRSE